MLSAGRHRDPAAVFAQSPNHFCRSAIAMTPTEMPSATQRIVDFEHPPVAETALGVVFAPIAKWNLFHFGLFWQRVRQHYPMTEVRPAAGPGELRFSAAEGIDFNAFPVRGLMIDSTGTQLIQVQRNAFIRNWRQTEQTAEYEHYENVRPLFERDWNTFSAFLQSESLGGAEVVQCEVTYINHLVRGTEWDSFEDVSRIFRLWSGKSVGELRASQMVSFMTAFELPDNAGRLQVVVQPGLRKSDSKEIIQFTLTATGKPTGSGVSDILQWLDIGHVAVVTSFRDLTTPEMHKHWGIK
jgi:uncharacterized protein (TIGR04255 family)